MSHRIVEQSQDLGRAQITKYVLYVQSGIKVTQVASYLLFVRFDRKSL